MKIDPRKEKCYSASEITRILREEFGLERSDFTVRRWMRTGAKGKVLDSVPVGGQLCSSLEALERFLDLKRRKK